MRDDSVSVAMMCNVHAERLFTDNVHAERLFTDNVHAERLFTDNVHAERLFTDNVHAEDCSLIMCMQRTVQMHAQELILFLPPEEMKQPQKRMSKAAFLSPFKYPISHSRYS
jgi:hypothetical protein